MSAENAGSQATFDASLDFTNAPEESSPMVGTIEL